MNGQLLPTLLELERPPRQQVNAVAHKILFDLSANGIIALNPDCIASDLTAITN